MRNFDPGIEEAYNIMMAKEAKLREHLQKLGDEEWAAENGHTCPPPEYIQNLQGVDNNE